MTTKGNIILNVQQVIQKTRRIAYQIYETNANETEIIIAGIADNGYLFAEKIAEVLSEISPIKVQLCKVVVDKKKPLAKEVEVSMKPEEYQNKSLVLVDDVLNSGATLIYGVRHFLNVPLVRFKTAVLVNRNHKKFPVKADFKGVSLSTSIKEHVEVSFDNGEATAYLI